MNQKDYRNNNIEVTVEHGSTVYGNVVSDNPSSIGSNSTSSALVGGLSQSTYPQDNSAKRG